MTTGGTTMKGKEGVTLLELMIVVVVVGILAAVAIPAYDNYVTRSRRSDAFTALETVRAAQEMYRAELGEYRNGGDFDSGLLPGCSPTMGGSNYTIGVNRITATTYSVRADPHHKQTGDFFLGTDHNGSQYTCQVTCPALDPSSLAGNWQLDSWEDLR
jgi:type IV pilus assembly protein PilE